MQHSYDLELNQLTVAFESPAEFCEFHDQELIGGRFFLGCPDAPALGTRLVLSLQVVGEAPLCLRATVDAHVDITGAHGAGIIFDEAQMAEVAELEALHQRLSVAATRPDLEGDLLNAGPAYVVGGPNETLPTATPGPSPSFGGTAQYVTTEGRAGALQSVPSAPPPSQPAVTPSSAAMAPSGPAAAHTLEAGSLVAGRFRIESHIATGGMGAVYLATHVYMGRKVALKLLAPQFAADPDMAARFQREAQLVAGLEHPNVVRVYDFGLSEDGRLYLAMEFAAGVPLEDLLKEQGALPPAQAVPLLVDVCSALGTAHAHGIVHRDVKPANIMVVEGPGGRLIPKVLDFGIARLSDAAQAGGSMTQAGIIIGTPQYLAPEQAYAEAVDGRTDIYALGAVAFHLLTGQLPYQSESLQKLVSMHITATIPSLADRRPELATFPALNAALQKAMGKSPDDRFATMALFAEALQGALQTQDPTALQAAAQAELQAQLEAQLPLAQTPTAQTPAAAPSFTPAPIFGDAGAPHGEGSGLTGVLQQTFEARPLTFELDQTLSDLSKALPEGLPTTLLDQILDARAQLARPGEGVCLHLHLQGLGRLSDYLERYEDALLLPKVVRALMLRLAHYHGGVLDWIERDEAIFLFADGRDLPHARKRSARFALRFRDNLEQFRRELSADLPLRVKFGWGEGPLEIPAEGGPCTGPATQVAKRELQFAAEDAVFVPQSIFSQDASAFVCKPNPRDPTKLELCGLTPPLYGAPSEAVVRQQELSVLVDLLEAAGSGPVTPLLIEGEASSGRSRLLEAAGERARELGFQVTLVDAPFPRSNAGYLERVARFALGLSANAGSSVIESALLKLQLPVHLTGSARVLLGIAPMPPGFEAPELALALASLLGAKATTRPVFLGLDDLHLADATSQGALMVLLQHPWQRVVLIATALAPIKLPPTIVRLELAPLRPEDCAALVRHTLAGAAPDSHLIDLVRRNSGSQPGDIVNWVLYLEGAGYLGPSARGVQLWGLPPALDAISLLDARVAFLSPDLQELARPALLCPGTFDQRALDAASRMVGSEPRWQQLTRAGLFRSRGRGRRHWSGHRWIQISPRDFPGIRATQHQRLARALRDQVIDLEMAPPTREIATHFQLAEAFHDAGTWWQRAAEASLRMGRLDRAAEACRALGLGTAAPDFHSDASGAEAPAAKEARAVSLGRAALLFMAAGRAKLAANLSHHPDLCQAESPQAKELFQLLTIRLGRGHSDQLPALEALLRTSSTPGFAPIVRLEMAEQLGDKKQYPAADPLFKEALKEAPLAIAVAPWTGDLDFQSRAGALYGRNLFRLGAADQAREVFKETADRLRRSGRQEALARVLSTLSSLAARAGDSEQAEAHLTESQQVAASAGDLRFLGRSWLAQARLLAQLGKGAEATSLVSQATVLAGQLGRTDLLAQAASMQTKSVSSPRP